MSTFIQQHAIMVNSFIFCRHPIEKLKRDNTKKPAVLTQCIWIICVRLSSNKDLCEIYDLITAILLACKDAKHFRCAKLILEHSIRFLTAACIIFPEKVG